MAITVYRGEPGAHAFHPIMDWANGLIFNTWTRFGEEPPNFWIAGGAPLDFYRGVEPRDYDLWFPDDENFDKVAQTFSLHGAVLQRATKSTAVYDFHYSKSEAIKDGTWELVRNYFDSADETVDFFDFTVAGIAVGHDYITYHEKFFEHFATKTLGINSTRYSLNTLRRLPKYVQKGFMPVDQDLERLAEAISNVDMDDEDQNIFKRIEKNEETYGNMPKSTKQNLNKATAAPMLFPTTYPALPKPSNSGIPGSTSLGVASKIKKLLTPGDGYF